VIGVRSSWLTFADELILHPFKLSLLGDVVHDHDGSQEFFIEQNGSDVNSDHQIGPDELAAQLGRENLVKTVSVKACTTWQIWGASGPSVQKTTGFPKALSLLWQKVVSLPR